MKESFFQFTNPNLVEIVFRLNSDFNVEDEFEVNIPTETKTYIKREKDGNDAVVSLDIIIGEETSACPFYCFVSMLAKFRWDEDANANVDDLLSLNAPALLLAYARPIISTITNSSPLPTFNIPFLDFTQRQKED